MPTPPIPSSEGDGITKSLTETIAASFAPKSEDLGVNFPLYDISMGNNSMSSDMSDVANFFDSSPSMPLSSASSTMQLDVEAALQSMQAATDPSNLFPSDFLATQQPDMKSLNAVKEDPSTVTLREGSPGSVPTPSSAHSHAASPIPGAFTTVSTTSLHSTLEENANMLNRSRSGSLASPNAAGFPSRISPPRASNEPSVKFSTPSDFGGISRPDPVNAPHMLVVDDVLMGIMRSAASARQACSMGQGLEASSKIDEMKKQISLVADLLAGTMLDTETSTTQAFFNGMMPSAGMQGHRHSLSLPMLNQPTAAAPGLIPNFPGVSNLSAMGQANGENLISGQVPLSDLSTGAANHGSPDSDSSRKRCGSSMGGTRVNKALRLESSDGGYPPSTQQATPSATGLKLPLGSASSLSSSQPTSLMPTPSAQAAGISISMPPPSSAGTTLTPLSVAAASQSPPSVPPSRSQSPPPAGLSVPSAANWPMLQKQLTASAPVTSAHSVAPRAQPSFPVVLPTTAPVPPMSDPGVQNTAIANPATATANTWADLKTSAPLTATGMIAAPTADGIGLLAYDPPSYPPPGHPPPPTAPVVPNAGLPPSALGRDSRSSSFSNPMANQLSRPDVSMATAAAYNACISSVPEAEPLVTSSRRSSPQEQNAGQEDRSRRLSRSGAPAQRRSPSSSSEEDGDSDYEGPYGRDRGYSFSKSSPPLKSRDNSQERSSQRQRPSISSPNDGQGASGNSHGNEIPQEFRGEVDRIFFDFLTKICSNLDATDAKGELIHQTLMAKKMQRLDESPDYRPFKFRIQAFTNGFLEELSRQGFTEEKIPMKKVRNYLWTQPYISRFNEDGKKAKSKGNHIWNIDAKKKPEGGWDFRPFRRKLAGSPPSIAYIGLRWSWTPRIWDPQASRANIQVQYSSPNLPPWLSWRDGVLQGTPSPDAQSCDVTVEARTVQDGREERLSQTFYISVSHVPTGTDMSFNGARPPLAVDLHNPRRINSDSMVPGVAGLSTRPVTSIPPQPTSASLSTQDAQMMQVLTSAAQRVAQEAQAHVIAAQHPGEPPGVELQSLAKQQHVLTVTAQALDHEVSSPPCIVPPASHALVAVAQQVVFQAARQVAADRTAVMSLATGLLPEQAPAAAAVTVNEVSVATQSAVAQAVEITGPLSSEVDVMMTASSLLQQAARPSSIPAAPMEPPLPASLDNSRTHSSGTIGQSFAPVLPNAIPSFPPASAVTPLSNMVPMGF